MMSKMKPRDRRRRAERRRRKREIRLKNEKVGPIVPEKDENGVYTLKNNIQHLTILKSINSKWDHMAGIRRRRVINE